MEQIERERLVADAILLERAVRVLHRRSRGSLTYDVAWLEHYAAALRQDAGAGPSDPQILRVDAADV